jgi:hypothetical protein
VDWIGLAQARNTRRALVNSAMNLRVSQNCGKHNKCLSSARLRSLLTEPRVRTLLLRGSDTPEIM